MNKKILIIISILFLVIINGCGGKKNINPITDVDVRKGKEGLLMEFIKNTPPDNIFENGKFPIQLRLKNAGAFDIVDIVDDEETTEIDEGTPEIEKGVIVFGFERGYISLVGKIEDEIEKLTDGELTEEEEQLLQVLVDNGVNLDEIAFPEIALDNAIALIDESLLLTPPQLDEVIALINEAIAAIIDDNDDDGAGANNINDALEKLEEITNPSQSVINAKASLGDAKIALGIPEFDTADSKLVEADLFLISDSTTAIAKIGEALEELNGITTVPIPTKVTDAINKLGDAITALSLVFPDFSVANTNLQDAKRLLKEEKDIISKFIDVLTDFRAKKEFSIRGKSTLNPVGDDEFIVVNAQAKKIGEQSETYPTTILATACYSYKTILGTSVCIDPDVLGQEKGIKACNVKDLIFNEGQGAPVEVTKIEVRILPDEENVKPHFIIHVNNAGDGQVIKSGVDEKGANVIDKVCSSQPDKPVSYKDFNVLKIKAALSGVVLDCNPDEGIVADTTDVRLKDKEDIIRCTYEGDDISISTASYTAPLKIEFDYGYTFTISKSVIIEKLLTY